MKNKSLEKMLQEQKQKAHKDALKKVLRTNNKKTLQTFDNLLKDRVKDDYFDDQNLISKKNVLRYFQISDKTLKTWRDYYDFPDPHYLGREVYFNKTEVKKFIRP